MRSNALGAHWLRIALFGAWLCLSSPEAQVRSAEVDSHARGAGGETPPTAAPMLVHTQALAESGFMGFLPWSSAPLAPPAAPSSGDEPNPSVFAASDRMLAAPSPSPVGGWLGSLGNLWRGPVRMLQAGPPLAADDQFVWGPNVGRFDIGGYLAGRDSALAEYAPDIELWASYSSVNPKILIALLELQHGWVSGLDPALPADQVRHTIERTAMRLASAFYEHLHVWGSRRPAFGPAPAVGPVIQFADGTAGALPPNESSATVALTAIIAAEVPASQFQIMGAGGFESTYAALFPGGDLLAENYSINPQSVPPEALLQFPFPLGATWVASGPHSWNGGSYPPPYSSLDFFVGGGTCSSPPNAYTVAAAYGEAYWPQGYSCWLELDHANGWVTSYYHLQNLYSGAPLGRGAKVGTIACETCAGGFATGPHVHFSLKYNGAYASLEGVKLSGWTVHVGSAPYTGGSYERGDQVLSPYVSLLNDYQSYYFTGYRSVRTFGNGTGDIDRLKIRMTDYSLGAPADVGKTDFTIEWWMKANPGENATGAAGCGANDAWRRGNILLDRDRFGQDRDYGVSLAGGRVVFGVGGNPSGQLSLCGSKVIADGKWHHVAVQRRASDGWLWIYVDGVLEAQGDGPDGDISYPDGAAVSNGCDGPCLNDPFLVIGAEKHGVDPTLRSFSGWIDELRISTVLRYSANFTPAAAPFASDANTATLYHFDDSPGNTAYDTSGALGGPSNASLRIGGSPAGPVWSNEVPFDLPTPTPSPTSTLHPSITPTVTPTPSRTPTASPTPSATPTSSRTPTVTPTLTYTATSTPTPTKTPSATATPPPTATSLPTHTPTPTNTATPPPTNTSTATPPPTNTATPGSPADLNQDGQVNVLDAQLCINVFLGTENDPLIVARADQNGDGAVNVLDVQLVVNAVLSG